MAKAPKHEIDQEELSLDSNDVTFDVALEKLEGLAAHLGEADIPLEQALEVYESAVHLFAYCRQRLDGIEQRIEQLSETLDGTLTVESIPTTLDDENG
jgi:exodeoxyribonuclease VII small subunit